MSRLGQLFKRTFGILNAGGRSAAAAIVLLLISEQMLLASQAVDDAIVAAVQKSVEASTKAFNEGKVDELTSMFLPQGEFINEAGTMYQGTKELTELFADYFKRFPGSKIEFQIESIRAVGPIVIEEGLRHITTKDGESASTFRYIAIRSKEGAEWKIASFRDFPENIAVTNHDRLLPVAWLVGDWVNEGTDGKVTITWKWSQDSNFLLGEFESSSSENPSNKSSQRIGWDPSTGKIRSWLFDNDGGFAEGVWTILEDSIMIKSSSVNPDGSTSSATLRLIPQGPDRFLIKGTDRIIGDSNEPDYEITVTRRPEVSAK
ncbi:nuclear transport factor 2 family protein [bacterium]|nr:nuclear transport factor 2 family protein [bacterium]